MRLRAENIYDEFHVLAYYYHWSEEQILRLSSRKRVIYVNKIAEQIKAENADGDEAD